MFYRLSKARLGIQYNREKNPCKDWKSFAFGIHHDKPDVLRQLWFWLLNLERFPSSCFSREEHSALGKGFHSINTCEAQSHPLLQAESVPVTRAGARHSSGEMLSVSKEGCTFTGRVSVLALAFLRKLVPRPVGCNGMQKGLLLCSACRCPCPKGNSLIHFPQRNRE